MLDLNNSFKTQKNKDMDEEFQNDDYYISKDLKQFL